MILLVFSPTVIFTPKLFTTYLKITLYTGHPLSHQQLTLLPTYQESRGQLETSEFPANLLRGSLSTLPFVRLYH